MSKPISPDPVVGPRNGDLPAYVSNGLVGLRIREMPLRAGVAVVNGVVDNHPQDRVEAIAPVPFPLAADIALDRVWLSDQPWAVENLFQSYDFETGELTSRFEFAAAERRLAVSCVTFASRTTPALVLQEVTMTADRKVDLSIRSIVETAGLRGRPERRRTATPGEEEPACDGSMLWMCDGGLSQCGLALVTKLDPETDKSRCHSWDSRGPLVTQYRLGAPGGKLIRLLQIAALIPSTLHERPDEEAVRQVAEAQRVGFEALRARNRAAWRDIWKGRVLVHGASESHQALIDAATFYLNASVHPASPAATSIFGLATWPDYHYYYGHVMWDIEAFSVPPLILMQPNAAKAILDFRVRGRRAAQSKARLGDRDGLQFPWEAAPRTAQEASPGRGSGAAHADHVSLHVARAFSLFADITGDARYEREEAWPIVSGVADWCVSRLTWTDRGAELLAATGPAEVPDPPDNDAFTLMAAADVLRRAIRMAQRIGDEVPDLWVRTLEHLCIPRRSDGIIASHDDFRIDEPKGATPSPLAGLFPYDFPVADRERQDTLEFYLKRWEDYVGSPMLPPLYPVWAAMAGDRRLALRLFEEGFAAYDAPRFHQCLEYRLDHPDCSVPAGPFFAHLGGMLMGLIYGMAGLVVDDGDPLKWPSRPVVLPEGWTAIEVERLWVRGRPARLLARHGADRAEISFT